MDIQQLLGVKPIKDVRSVLCVQPHPDDNEVGMGGTVKYLSERGARVVFVTVTDGRYGASDTRVSPERLIQIRQNEKMAAGKLLGVHHHYDLGFEDNGDYSEREVTEALVSIIREEKPELVATVDPWMPYEAHPDHYKVGRAVAASVLASGNISFPSLGRPYMVPQVAFYSTSFPNAFVDVTDYWEVKMQAILAHKSQFDHPEWPLLSQYFTYQAAKWKQMDPQQPSDSTEHQSPRLAEAFKVLSTRQLHFFPDAINS
jgi:LmbE family N-acetylglucosaminyl deacetylase